MKNNISKKLKDQSVSFEDFYDLLLEKDLGSWDDVNGEEIIKQYVSEMMLKGVYVSHILEAIEKNPSNKEVYSIWLGNSMETPEPINTKKELYYALGLNHEFGEVA